jgi:hypothetical protein
MDFSALRSATARISSLVDRAAQTALKTEQIEELRRCVEALDCWPRGDPASARARKLATSVYVSGILASPSKRPTLPEQILSECHFLLGYLDARA